MEGAKRDLSSKKRAVEVEEASNVSKRQKTDGEIEEDVSMSEPMEGLKQGTTKKMKSKKRKDKKGKR